MPITNHQFLRSNHRQAYGSRPEGLFGNSRKLPEFTKTPRHFDASKRKLISDISLCIREFLVLDETDHDAVVCGLRQGQRDAWSALYDGYSVDVWRYVARLVGPDSAAVADVVQETFLVAARSARQFDRERGTLWSWLTGIAHNQSALYWRQIHKADRLQELVDSRGDFVRRWMETDSTDAIWRQSEIVELVRAALSELSADYAALLTAKYLDDRSLEELSLNMGGSVDAVKSKLARARREFRSVFEKLTREPPENPPDSLPVPKPVSQTERP